MDEYDYADMQREIDMDLELMFTEDFIGGEENGKRITKTTTRIYDHDSKSRL